MRLLVSVSNEQEAEAGLRGGADIIDAKDPSAGALGAVAPDVAAALARICRGQVLFTAALGDAGDPNEVERLSESLAAAGADLVKLGFGGVRAPKQVEASLSAAIRGATRVSARAGVIAVAYADAARVASAAPSVVAAAAVATGAAGVLLDTADKAGPGIRTLMSRDSMKQWTDALRADGLVVAVAGKLSADDLAWLAPLDVDIAGVRGAACEGGRLGRTSAHLVTMLRARCGGAHQPALVWPVRLAGSRA